MASSDVELRENILEFLARTRRFLHPPSGLPLGRPDMSLTTGRRKNENISRIILSTCSKGRPSQYFDGGRDRSPQENSFKQGSPLVIKNCRQGSPLVIQVAGCLLELLLPWYSRSTTLLLIFFFLPRSLFLERLGKTSFWGWSFARVPRRLLLPGG